MNRIHKKKRKTLSRESNLSQIIKDFELKTSPEKVASLHFFTLEAGTYTSGKLDPVYFDLISALTELEFNPESQPIISVSFRGNRGSQFS